MRTRHHLTRLGAVVTVITVAALSTVAVAGPASAAVSDETGPSAAVHGKTGKACVLAARSWTDQAVAKRLVRLDTLTAALAKASNVTDGHRAQLAATYKADRAGLKAVRTEVRHDSTCKEATKDSVKVIKKFRVYVLLSPQTSLTIRGDRGVAWAEAYEALEPGYATAIAALPDGTTKAAAEAALARLVLDADAAQASYGGVADSVLALVPADFPAQAGVLTAAAAQARAGHASLTSAALERTTLDALLS
jgi:hypothetical protein